MRRRLFKGGCSKHARPAPARPIATPMRSRGSKRSWTVSERPCRATHPLHRATQNKGRTMAQLTPLAKGLITMIILGGTGAAAWHLGLRELITREPVPAQPVSERAEPEEPDRKAQAPEQETRTDIADGGLLGSRGNPLKVSLVSFHGYAPALLANGLSLTTKPGSIFAQKGVAVEFILQDDIPTL